jgi:cytidylate kinase
MENEHQAVAIDGPAASGKSTVARRVAAALGFLYVDSGAVYRGVAWKALREGVDVHSPEALVALLASARFEFLIEDGAVRYRIDGEDPGGAIRTEEVNVAVSPVAATPRVREQVVMWLRAALRFGDLVMEGRDIGSVVFPGARHKFYLDADPEERARRRHREMVESQGAEMSEASVGESLKRRDARDRGRATAPLRIVEGAAVVDTTHMNIDQVVEAVLAHVRRAEGLGPDAAGRRG